MSNPHDIAAALGRDTIRHRLKVGVSAISMAIHRGAFPPAWFDEIEALCKEAGIDCPRSAFAFRKSCKRRGDAPTAVQVGGGE